MNELSPNARPDCMVARHFRFGWWSILVFLVLGLVLETLHGFKSQWFLAEQYEARRLVWRLAHAHGTLLGILHIAFAFTVSVMGLADSRRSKNASRFLHAATVLLPGGFFLGGIYVYDGDPGLGVFLAPFGGLALLVAVVLVALDVSRGGQGAADDVADDEEAEDGEPVA